MLENYHGSNHGLEEAISRLPCEILLPPSMKSFFDEDERLSRDDRRKMVRLIFRKPAALEYPEESQYGREPGWKQVYMKDISLCGVAFLHAVELFPQERLRLIITSPKSVLRTNIEQDSQIEVVRCRRLGEKCHFVGAKVVTDVA